MTFSAFHYLTLSVRCEELDAYINKLYLFLKSTYCEYILEKILSTSEVGPILALIAPSPLSTFWLKIEQFWIFEEIFIFSNGGHLGYRTALTDTILKGDHLRIISAKLVEIGSVVSEEKIFFKFHPPFFYF